MSSSKGISQFVSETKVPFSMEGEQGRRLWAWPHSHTASLTLYTYHACMCVRLLVLSKKKKKRKIDFPDFFRRFGFGRKIPIFKSEFFSANEKRVVDIEERKIDQMNISSLVASLA